MQSQSEGAKTRPVWADLISITSFHSPAVDSLLDRILIYLDYAIYGTQSQALATPTLPSTPFNGFSAALLLPVGSSSHPERYTTTTPIHPCFARAQMRTLRIRLVQPHAGGISNRCLRSLALYEPASRLRTHSVHLIWNIFLFYGYFYQKNKR